MYQFPHGGPGLQGNISSYSGSNSPVGFGWGTLQHLHSKWILATLEACPSIKIADWVRARAAAVMIITAGGRIKRAAAPGIAVASEVLYLLFSFLTAQSGWGFHLP